MVRRDLREIAPPGQLERSVASLTMAVEILFGSSAALLLATFVFWFREGFGRSFRLWRRIVVWLSLLALTVAVLTFLRFLCVVGRPEFSNLDFVQRLDATLPMMRAGFWFATAALISCWFATFKTTICGAASSGIIWILWVAQEMGI